jgi:hypothetical protein
VAAVTIPNPVFDGKLGESEALSQFQASFYNRNERRILGDPTFSP